jgi:hypothetical protein
MARRRYLFLLGLGHHVGGHIPDTLVNDLGHRRHDSLRLGTVQPLAFQPLDKVVRIEMEVSSTACRMDASCCGDGSGEYWRAESTAEGIG